MQYEHQMITKLPQLNSIVSQSDQNELYWQCVQFVQSIQCKSSEIYRTAYMYSSSVHFRRFVHTLKQWRIDIRGSSQKFVASTY